MNNFWQRVLTGILFVIVVAGGIFYHPFSFFAVFFLVVLAGIYELNGLLVLAKIKTNFLFALAIGVFSYVAAFLVKSGVSENSIYYLLIPIVSLLFIQELFDVQNKPFEGIGTSLVCAIYIGVPFAMLNSLAFLDGVYNFKLPLSVFILVWINDTGAYLSGVTLGRHKFFERISPKKTWEGTVGGFVLTLVAGYVISIFWKDLSVLEWIIFSSIISIMAVLGDLIESLFKRSIGIKDSGNIFPGHGGVLDRFDAVIFAIPMAVFYIEMFVR
ncbi:MULTISPECIES: phosphatidate cytidylyltransferase [unclassified Saccharicrinis]|uniref:phosphatidate cytidylyltransferase n=1 Tax=unclassified Saccharicrinis TaxID=2646859 RepID=UPI003D34A0BC